MCVARHLRKTSDSDWLHIQEFLAYWSNIIVTMTAMSERELDLWMHSKVGLSEEEGEGLKVSKAL